MDINEDGYITWDEWDGNERMFDRFDADGSGDLDPDEIDAIKQRMEQRGSGRRGERPQRRSFEEMDSNSDSVITADEFRGPEEAFSRIDADGDGQINREEMEAASSPRPPTFEELDVNDDSFISADEFRGNQTAFSRADVNGDGQITREEMEGAWAFPVPPDSQ